MTDQLPSLTRRHLLRSTGAVAGAALAAACSPGAPSGAPPASTGAGTPEAGAGSQAVAGGEPSTATGGQAVATPRPAGVTPATFDALPRCQLTPAAAEGPFPNLERLQRSDITEGRPGQPIDLALRVVDDACAPVPGSEVEVWHTDHTGDYSMFQDGGSGKDEGQDTTFCRGVQTADDDGIVVFRTIVPGWYDGRAIHIHLTCRRPDGVQLTTQLYFDETFTDAVMTQGVYAEFGLPDTSVARDGLAGDPAAAGTQLVTREADDGSVQALLNLGVA